MTATFNPALTDLVSKVRQKLGDTDVKHPEVQDETIKAYLTERGNNILQVTYQLALDLQAKYAKYGDVTVDDQLQRFKHIYENYSALVARLAREIAGAGPNSPVSDPTTPTIIVGGLNDCRGPIDCDWDGMRYGRC